METPCWCPSEGHQHGGRKLEKTSGVHFCQKIGLFSLVSFRKFGQIFLLILALFRMLKIAGRVILKYGTALAQPSSWCHARWKFGNWNCSVVKKNARYRAEELWRDIFLGNLSLDEGKISVGLLILNIGNWWRHVKTKNCFGPFFYSFLFLCSTSLLNVTGSYIEGDPLLFARFWQFVYF